MSVVTLNEGAPEHYLSSGWGLSAWLLTKDHKRIAWLYTASITLFFFLGGFAALFMRLELMSPTLYLMDADTYNRLFTAHGIIMVWFFLIPSIPATLGNFLMPLMLGAPDLAFPRLNLLSWYIFMGGGLFIIAALVGGGVDTGWTFYTPYSTDFSPSSVTAAALGIFLVGFSSILTALNFVVTTHKMRAPGLTFFRLPLFVWAMYATSLVMLLATPVLSATLIMIAAHRMFGLDVFNPNFGPGPLLYQHLFWFYSHPAVYIMILPAMGVVSEIIACFSRRPLFSYKGMVISLLAIAIFGFLAWGHHMFVSGQSIYASLLFSFFTFVVAVPSAIKTFNWTATLYKGSITFSAPMIYALSFIGLFAVGGLTGIILAATAVDVDLTDTFFVVAHFHYIMVGGAVTAFMGGLHFWWPKITGRMYPEILARMAAVTLFFGFNFTFFPQFLLGTAGMPRRYATYPPEFQNLNVISTLGAAVLAVGYLLPFCYLLMSLRWGAPAGSNPWQAKGLEWQTSSPPPPQNFIATPKVTESPYAYE